MEVQRTWRFSKVWVAAALVGCRSRVFRKGVTACWVRSNAVNPRLCSFKYLKGFRSHTSSDLHSPYRLLDLRVMLVLDEMWQVGIRFNGSVCAKLENDLERFAAVLAPERTR